MSNVSGVGSPSVYGGTTGMPVGVSPDDLVAYCSAELSSLDGQISTLMQQQQQQIKDQQVVNQAEQTLNQFPNGPQNPSDFQSCINAVDQAEQSLPPNDPTRASLESFKQSMIQEYGYSPGGTSTMIAPCIVGDTVGAKETFPVNLRGIPAGAVCTKVSPPLTTEWQYQSAPSLGTQPTSTTWSATLDSLKNVGSNAASDAQIGMLQLNNLVSQRQQAVEEASGMMQNEDQTLSDLAKAIGQG